MKFKPPLIQATLLKRYKRFLADIRLSDGKLLTVHCPNTGAMTHCLVEESPCWISLSDNPKRKLPGTLEITTTTHGALAGVNTGLANKLVEEAILNGTITELGGYETLHREVKYGSENSRIDFLLGSPQEKCYVEVKNVTLESGDGGISFPDAVTARGTKHLRELCEISKQGHRAVLLFCVQHSAAQWVSVASEIDPVYSDTLKEAMKQGLEVLAYVCKLGPEEIAIQEKIDFRAPL